jgi:hypothetical protein
MAIGLSYLGARLVVRLCVPGLVAFTAADAWARRRARRPPAM